jgi:predicted amidophosphoribosyltransferase
VTDSTGRLAPFWGKLRAALATAVDVVLPPRCVACAVVVDTAAAGAGVWCETCAEGLEVAPRPGLLVYAGSLSGLIQQAKYGRDVGAAHALASLMADRLDRDALGVVDVVTFVPAHWSRAIVRGFDLPALLADAVALRVGAPRRALLTVHRRDPRLAQAASWADRQRLVAGRFGCAPEARGQRVLLVDDVHTTGATLGAATEALRLGGASTVVSRTLALTPGVSSG